MLGLSQTYQDAQRVVLALERAQVDDSYYSSAVDIIGSYVEPQRTEVIEKAIALGADPDTLRQLVANSGTVDKKPVKSRGWVIALGILMLIGGALAYRKRMKVGFAGLSGYRVVYLIRAERTVSQFVDLSLEAAQSHLRTLKRRGMTAWIEDEDGRFVPVHGAMRKPKHR